MNIKRIAGVFVAVLLIILPLTACSKKDVNTVYSDKKVGFQLEKPAKGDKIAIMNTSMGDIKIRFFSKAAPKTVENFQKLSEKGYYNGLTFHRVINNFMIQGGDPTGTGRGGESFWGGKFEDEFDDKLLNLRGSLAMANSGVNTNGSQFFINQSPVSKFPDRSTFEESYIKNQYKVMYEQNKAMLNQYGYSSWQDYYKQNSGVLAPDPKLVPEEVWKIYEKNGGNINLDGAWRKEGGHTVFGQVFEGMDVVDAIAAVKTDKDGLPEKEVTINTIQILDYNG